MKIFETKIDKDIDHFYTYIITLSSNNILNAIILKNIDNEMQIYPDAPEEYISAYTSVCNGSKELTEVMSLTSYRYKCDFSSIIEETSGSYYTIINTAYLKIDELGSGEICDKTMWGIRNILASTNIVRNRKPKHFENVYINSYRSKHNPFTTDTHTAYNIVVGFPFEDSMISNDDSNTFLFVNAVDADVYYLNIDTTNKEEIQTYETMQEKVDSLYPTLVCNMPDSLNVNSTGTKYEVQAMFNGNKLEKDIEVFLSTTAGYINKSRFTLKNGVGSFIFEPYLMESGDTATIRLGFKNYTAVSRFDVKVEEKEEE